jgi:hypothetical protein
MHVAKKTNKSNAVGTQAFAVIRGFPTRNNISMFTYAFLSFFFSLNNRAMRERCVTALTKPLLIYVVLTCACAVAERRQQSNDFSQR